MNDKEILSMQAANTIMTHALEKILQCETWDCARKVAYETLEAFRVGSLGTYGWDCRTAKDITAAEEQS